jgi:ABC-2 type transport system ATP-binding protein
MQPVVFESVTKVFPNRSAFLRRRGAPTTALEGVSFSLDHGSITALLGPNGSGKTTLMKLIATMLLPDRGSIRIGGCSTSSEASAVRRQVGFAVVGERSFYPRLSARENLTFFATLDDVPAEERGPRVERALEQVELLDVAERLVMQFSSGMHQRLGIARALLKNPTVLLLDEPSRSLDPDHAEHLWNLLRDLQRAGTTVLVATHNFNEAAAVADSVVVLSHGKLLFHGHVPDADDDDLRRIYREATADMSAPALAMRGGV